MQLVPCANPQPHVRCCCLTLLGVAIAQGGVVQVYLGVPISCQSSGLVGQKLGHGIKDVNFSLPLQQLLSFASVCQGANQVVRALRHVYLFI